MHITNENMTTAQPLRWTQTARGGREYALRNGDASLATLRWERKICSTTVYAGAGAAHWVFATSGFWKRVIRVRSVEQSAEIATMSLNWKQGGTLDCADGRQFVWTAASRWHTEWAWRDESGVELLHFKGEQHWLKMDGRMDVAPDAATLPDLPLLASLGWYLFVQRVNEEVASSAGISAVAATS